eukprot:gene17958-21975_t
MATSTSPSHPRPSPTRPAVPGPASGPSPARAQASTLLILVAGCLIAMLTFGPRSASGFFLLPMSNEFGWGRDVFGLALALQNLLWGLGSPFA